MSPKLNDKLMRPSKLDYDVRLLVPLADFAREIGVTYLTVWKWSQVGRLNRATGRTVYLKTPRQPSGLATSWELYERFIAELNEEP